jgi:hypothetical protein
MGRSFPVLIWEKTLVDNSFDWGIGEDGLEVGGGEFFNGQIDEVCI